MRIRIRSYQPQDQEEVVRIWKECGLVVPQNDPVKDIRRKLRRQRELFRVAIAGGKVVGTIMGGYDGHRGWINYLGVDPSRRGLGTAKKLMGDMEGRLKKLGCPKINLQVRISNAGVGGFYEKLGYARDKVFSYGKRLVHEV